MVDLDLEKFFDTVNHDVLLSRVARKVRDKTLLSLMGRYLRAGVMVEGVRQATAWGDTARFAAIAVARQHLAR